VIVAKGRPAFLDAVQTRSDFIALNVGLDIREMRINEGDPGRNRLLRLVDTVETGKPERLTIWTDTADLPAAFWNALPAYAKRLAKLEREFITSQFFGKVLAVAVATDPIGLAMYGTQKKDFKSLIKAIPEAFHSALLLAKAAEGSPEIIEFLKANFAMAVTAGHLGRYLRLQVLRNVCGDVSISLARPTIARPARTSC
jgi:hypothetical protein